MTLPDGWFDVVENAVIEQYDKLKVKGDVDNSVLAGFLLLDSSKNELSVITLATGTKLMSGDQREKTSKIGPLFVHDCHSEILAHRCLQIWIWNELDGLLKDGKLPDNFTLHFYSSTPPCGDCCVHESDGKVSVETGAKPFGWDQSQLASSPPNIVRGKPGRGSRSQVVSCSDKITMWISSGVEGSLLSQSVKINLSSICIGDGKLESLKRCFFGRLNSSESVKIFTKESRWRRRDDSPSAASVSWVRGSEKYELTAAKFGRKFGVIEKNQEDPRFFPTMCDAMMIQRYCKRNNIKNIKFSDLKDKFTEYNDRKKAAKEKLIGYGGEWAAKFPAEKDWVYDEENMKPKVVIKRPRNE